MTSLDDVLKKFPFSYREQDRQSQVLADYLIGKLEGGKNQAAEKAGVSKPTIREIEQAFTQLDAQEMYILLKHLQTVVDRRILEDTEMTPV